jgi:hypothetical protein
MWKAERLFRLQPRVMPRNRFEDPVYKKNVRELIERHRKFEEAKE